MPRTSFKTALAALAVVAGTTASFGTGPITLHGVDIGQINPGLVVRPGLPNVVGRLAINCPAPAVLDVTASLLGGNMVRIEAEIENIGGIDWRSGAHQQAAVLVDDTGATLSRNNFAILPAGDSFILRADRVWNPTSEFQTGFRADIAYDPDILRDGNTANDDCRLADNSGSISPAEINALFH